MKDTKSGSAVGDGGTDADTSRRSDDVNLWDVVRVPFDAIRKG